tara:strand:+ start:1088 stop:1495 length:408 start_codon:yes stop_codon:yes gene_type:complete
MIKIIGKTTNKRSIERSAKLLAGHLKIDEDVNIMFMEHESTDKYGFAAEILGTKYICLFKGCPDEELNRVISHEMIHVHQMVRGDLVFDHDNMIFTWKGDKYNRKRLDTMSYYDRPWEDEAKKLEKKLASDFFMS